MVQVTSCGSDVSRHLILDDCYLFVVKPQPVICTRYCDKQERSIWQLR